MTEEGSSDKGTFGLLERQTATLRYWFLAFGVGAPALILTNNGLLGLIRQSGYLTPLMVCFLVGVGSQILETWLNRGVNLTTYLGEVDGEQDSEFRNSRTYRAAVALSRQVWIDILMDFVTILAFGAAAYFFVLALNSQPGTETDRPPTIAMLERSFVIGPLSLGATGSDELTSQRASGFGGLRRPPTQPAQEVGGVGERRCVVEEDRTSRRADWARFGGPER